TPCDLTNPHQLTNLLNNIPTQHPLTTLIHTAGINLYSPVAATDEAALASVLAAKAAGAANLHELLLAHDTLEQFILFSSGASAWGSGNQGAYAAANAHLDALAAYRQARGLPGMSIAWGPWDGAGMSAGEDAQRYLRERGVLPMDPRLALHAFDLALRARSNTNLVVAEIDWDRFVPTFTSRGDNPLIQDIPEVRGLARRLEAERATTTSASDTPPLRERLAGLTASQQNQQLLRLVRTHMCEVLGRDETDEFDQHRAFNELGFDSLTSAQFSRRLAEDTGLQLPTTLLFDHPTPADCVVLLRAQLLTGDDVAPQGQTAHQQPSEPDEPIAIVGMACRFPGEVRSAEDLWDLLASGADAIGSFPTDRGWDLDHLYHPDPDHPGTTYTRHGGFLYDAGEFDADFFGINPREALAMDPQQRLLLETAWETIEHAGINPQTLQGTSTGVFTGINAQDYAGHLRQAKNKVEGYALTGSSGSVASGRVAYTLGLEGPAVSVDTACSSSLVALHLACQALRSGECTMALTSGVMVLSSPETFVEFSRQRGLSVDGRCKSFAAAADGTGWGEGVGMLLVERLSDAERHGHRVLAVVRGSAVNQDGASNGLTAPNGPSQQRVIRQALASAGLSALDIDAVEGHGTGTRLGDPIEAQALLATYGQHRSDERPLWLGSLKSNIGHAQAAAGVGGIIKMVMALQNELLPRTLHVDEPSPHIDWASGSVQLLTEARPWVAEGGRVRRAGVSSFGVSGTNAHVILEEAPVPEPAVEEDGEPGGLPVPWVFSGRSEAGLRAQARALLDFVRDHPEAQPAAVGAGLVRGRAVLEHRAVVVACERGEFVRALEAVASDEPHPCVIDGRADTRPDDNGVVFVFPGQGGQWAGMGLDLLRTSPVFAERIGACEEALARWVPWSLTGMLHREEGDPVWEQADVVQPVLFAVMVSLAALWRSYGIEPDAVVGHSQGEIAAAHVCGALSLADAAKTVALRSRALTALRGRGGMASLSLPGDTAGELIEQRWAGRLWVAAFNSPHATTVSGDTDALDELLTHCQETGVRARRVPVDYASHCPHTETIEDELLDALADIAPQASTIPFYSTVDDTWTDTTQLDAAYWYRNLRQPVRFTHAVRALSA
ncbi:beta-ketoacyl synthase N-terminal-like domain-containing protein, partial [Streptomyces sp. NPDC020800]|uniref:type I polyketide synthase n=1 Tax=Streptomyces sp. NPDC020800 TaxID=3365092 RepID=UPI00379C6653